MAQALMNVFEGLTEIVFEWQIGKIWMQMNKPPPPHCKCFFLLWNYSYSQFGTYSFSSFPEFLYIFICITLSSIILHLKRNEGWRMRLEEEPILWKCQYLFLFFNVFAFVQFVTFILIRFKIELKTIPKTAWLKSILLLFVRASIQPITIQISY